MNAQPGVAESHATYRFRWDEVLRMVETGILPDDARVELIEGELIQVAPESLPHAKTKWWISRFISRELDWTWTVATDSPAVLSPENAPEPDVFVFPASVDAAVLRGADIVLAIEVSVSSLALDLNAKAALYARHGVQEYWVIDVQARRVIVHRAPSDLGYADVAAISEGGEIVPAALSMLKVKVADLPKFD